MCKNKTSESAGATSAQDWLNEAQGALLSAQGKPAVVKTQDKNLRRAVQCIIYACRQFRERAGELAELEKKELSGLIKKVDIEVKADLLARKERRRVQHPERRIKAGIAPGVLKERRLNLIGRRVVGTRRKSDMRYMPPLLDMHAGEEEKPKVSFRQNFLYMVDLLLSALPSGLPPGQIESFPEFLGRRNIKVAPKDCKTCIFYEPEEKNFSYGKCHCLPPTAVGRSNHVFEYDWCGKHRREEVVPILKGAEETVVNYCLAKECRNYSGAQGCMRKLVQMSTDGSCCNIESLSLRE